MRTLSSTSRALSVTAAIIAAVLISGGAFFVGYVGELQRDLNDPSSLRTQAAVHFAAVEKSLGYGGFLKLYRNYRLTGDPALRLQLSRSTLEAAHAIKGLKAVYANNPAAAETLREASAISETFAHIARTAPEMGSVALRGTAAMDALSTLPQSPQLEATYVSLRTALDRLRQAELDHQLGGAASALNWSQMLIVATIGSLVLGLLIVAGLLQLGIIQPLKSLERSLASVGEGAISQKIWGIDRVDEFGALARAGEKVRRGLLETTALKALAEKSQLHISLDGQSSVLFEKLAADVTSAAETLKTASADLLRLQGDNSKQFDTTVQKLTQSTAGIDDAANALRQGTAAAVDDMRASTAKLAETAMIRVRQMDEIATRFDQGGRKFEETAAFAQEKSATILEDMATTTGALKGLAGETQAIQNAFFSACDKISSDAANTTENVRTLASRLNDAVGGVDERLGRKLSALDTLEHGLTETLAKLQARADETVSALDGATNSLGESSAAADARIKQNVADFEEVLRIFRDDETAMHQSSSRTMAELQAAQRTLVEAAEAQTQENRQLAAAIARLNEIAGEFRRPQPAPEPSPALPAAELQELAGALKGQGDAIRAEIRDLAVRLTEDRLLAAADMPFLAAKGGMVGEQSGQRTLADVPGDEIMSRLKNLAAEMSAAQDQFDQVASLKDALGSFATDVKKLAVGADRAARLKNMGKALDRHADEIEARAQAIAPSAETLRGDLHDITSELRTIAARAQSNGVKEGPALREAAIDLGARAETLFSSLNEAQDDADIGTEFQQADAGDATTADLAALAQLIGRLEARAEHLSRATIAANLDDISDSLSPVEHQANARHAGPASDGAIHTVFESIERLNNIAAALARTGDVERQRRAAH